MALPPRPVCLVVEDRKHPPIGELGPLRRGGPIRSIHALGANAQIRGKQNDIRPIQGDGAGVQSVSHGVSMKREEVFDYPAASLIET